MMFVIFWSSWVLSMIVFWIAVSAGSADVLFGVNSGIYER